MVAGLVPGDTAFAPDRERAYWTAWTAMLTIGTAGTVLTADSAD